MEGHALHLRGLDATPMRSTCGIGWSVWAAIWRCAGSRAPTSGTWWWRSRPTRGSSTSSSCGAVSTGSGSTTRTIPRIARSPVGDSSVCYGQGYAVPDWAVFDPDARPGELVELMVRSQAQRRDNRVTLYLPARFRTTTSYPLLVVHDGGDFLEYASMKTVLDNLIHRLDMAETVVAFTYPGERLTEYPEQRPARPLDHQGTGAAAGGAVPADRAPVRPRPDGVELRGDRVAEHGGPLPARRTGRCCCSRARSCSPTSASATRGTRPSTRW